MEHPPHCTRRQVFRMAGAGLAARLYAAGSDFWNKKPPSQWTSQEIDLLITKSPWAREVHAQYAAGEGPSDMNGGGYPGGNPGGGYPGGNPGGGYPGGGYPGGPSRGGIGGLGIPGIGGIGFPGGGGRPRNGGGTPRGGAMSAYQGTVRWESALPVMDAMKAALPEAFDGHYVICVSGIPLLSNSRYQGEDDDSASSRRQEQDDLDRMKGLSSLQVKGKELVQAGVVARQVSSGSSFLFGFSRELLPLAAHDPEVSFSSRLGRLVVKARFLPKEMLYHGDLAV
jgi:hypothetical protein